MQSIKDLPVARKRSVTASLSPGDGFAQMCVSVCYQWPNFREIFKSSYIHTKEIFVGLFVSQS